MKFKAIGVEEGDCLLLENDGFTMVVDGGRDTNKMPGILKGNMSGKSIDVLVCTHYDSDHVDGIISILMSSIDVDELWLPDIFGDIYKTLVSKEFENEDFRKWNDIGDYLDINEIEYEDISINSIEKETDENCNFELYNCPIFNLMEIIANEFGLNPRLLKQNNLVKTLETMSFRVERRSVGYNSISEKMIRTLEKIHKILYLCLLKDIKIRWLKYYKKTIDKPISFHYNVYGLNCKQVPAVSYKRIDKLIKAILYLSKENRESLVLKYDEEGHPNILYCSDSDFSFYNKKKYRLANKSIVTAPHHGSKENKQVYDIIQGKNLVYVRTYHRRVSPCKKYLSKNKRYCTKCITKNNSTTISLSYINNNWSQNSSTKPCTC